MRQRAFRVGDRVRILSPFFVVRVGYPLAWPMLRDEFDEHPKVDEALALFGIKWLTNDKIRREFVDGICRAAVRDRGFGGKERSIHTVEKSCYLDQIEEVISRRTVRTGKYYGPSGGYDAWSGEYDYEPGGLDEARSHILLMTGAGEIETRNVVLVNCDHEAQPAEPQPLSGQSSPAGERAANI